MPQLQRFLETHYQVLFGLAAAAIVAWSVYFAWRRHRHGPIHPAYGPDDAAFTERFVSGYSSRNLMTRIGGQNALVVRVLKDGLLVEPWGLFKWIMPMRFNDVEHWIPWADLERLQPVPGIGRRQSVRIEFRAHDGEPRVLEIALRDMGGFLRALAPHKTISA